LRIFGSSVTPLGLVSTVLCFVWPKEAVVNGEVVEAVGVTVAPKIVLDFGVGATGAALATGGGTYGGGDGLPITVSYIIA
jgi:hypothetical protein